MIPGRARRALVRGDIGWDFIDECKPLDTEDVVDGAGKGKFLATDLALILRQRGITTVLFGGVTTACCVQTTMRDAADHGYSVALIADATGDYTPMDQYDCRRSNSVPRTSSSSLLTTLLRAHV